MADFLHVYDLSHVRTAGAAHIGPYEREVEG